MPSRKKHKKKSQETSLIQGAQLRYAGIILLVTFLVFGNTMRNGFTYDDKAFISENYLVQQGFAGIPKLLTTDFWHGYTNASYTNPSYRPIPLITLAIEYHFFGLSSGTHHFFNVLLYGLTCVLIYFLLLTLFRGKYPYLAMATAILFCVHPIHTEVVANIKGRDDLLALFNALLSLYLIFRYSETKKIKFVGLAMVTYMLALMSKEHVITWIVIVPLSFWFFGNLPLRKIFVYTIPFLATTLLYFMIRSGVIGHKLIGHIDSIDNPIMAANGIGEIWATKLATLFLFIQKLTFPYPLSSDYSFGVITPTSWSDPSVYFALVCYGLFAFLAIRGLRSKTVWSFAILVFLVTLAPVSNILVHYTLAFAERSMYTPSFGFVLFLASGCYVLYAQVQTNQWVRRLAPGLGVVLILACATLSIARNGKWKNDLTLFSTDVATYPNSVRLNMNYAQVLIEKNTAADPVPMNTELEQAKTSIDRAMSLRPDFARGHLYYGNIHKVTGNYDAAEAQYLRAQELDSINPVVFFNLALIAQIRENLDEAKAKYLKCLEVAPNHVGALSNLGIIYGRQNEIDKCIATLEKAFSLKPDALGAANLEQAYTIKGNAVKAAYYRELKSTLR